MLPLRASVGSTEPTKHMALTRSGRDTPTRVFDGNLPRGEIADSIV